VLSRAAALRLRPGAANSASGEASGHLPHLGTAVERQAREAARRDSFELPRLAQGKDGLHTTSGVRVRDRCGAQPPERTRSRAVGNSRASRAGACAAETARTCGLGESTSRRAAARLRGSSVGPNPSTPRTFSLAPSASTRGSRENPGWPGPAAPRVSRALACPDS
jgi:hypothetical protein